MKEGKKEGRKELEERKEGQNDRRKGEGNERKNERLSLTFRWMTEDTHYRR